MEVSDMKNTSTVIAAGLTILCLSTAAAVHAETGSAPAQVRKQATVIPDAAWATYQKESGHAFSCGDAQSGATGYVLIGRSHDGDETNHTGYRCAKVDQDGILGTPVAYSSHEIDLPAGINFTCPIHEVLTGRAHEGDENEPETLQCGTLADLWGNRINVIPGEWSPTFKENLHEYVCPAGTVMIGKYHKGDENGDTQYRCGTLW
jgi:hypothetical protein